jgi:hypothetical protein
MKTLTTSPTSLNIIFIQLLFNSFNFNFYYINTKVSSVWFETSQVPATDRALRHASFTAQYGAVTDGRGEWGCENYREKAKERVAASNSVSAVRRQHAAA